MERTSPTKPMTQRCPLHIRACAHPAIPAETVQQIDALEAEIKTAAPRIDDVRAFGPGVVQGCGAGTGVWFGDTAEIPLLGLNLHKRFDYRLGWLASEGDIVVIGGPSCPAFEAYQRGRLAAPGLTYLNIDPHIRTPRASTLALCLRDPEAYGRLVAALAGASGVTLHAHLTTGRAWALAALLYQDLGVNVHVSGPPPNLSQLTNNKLWFGKVVQRLLGTGAIPEKRAAHSASALTRHVADLARKRAQLVIKLPDSAGSEGNFIIVAREIRGLTLRALRERLIADLSSAGCQRRFPFLVEVWDANVLANPSVQTWIPLPTEGPPVIEGIFEQILSDDRAAFAGAVQIDPPQLVRDLLLQGRLPACLAVPEVGLFRAVQLRHCGHWRKWGG